MRKAFFVIPGVVAAAALSAYLLFGDQVQPSDTPDIETLVRAEVTEPDSMPLPTYAPKATTTEKVKPTQKSAQQAYRQAMENTPTMDEQFFAEPVPANAREREGELQGKLAMDGVQADVECRQIRCRAVVHGDITQISVAGMSPDHIEADGSVVMHYDPNLAED